MNNRVGPVLLLLLIWTGTGYGQETLFFTGFEYGDIDQEPHGLLESGELNGANDQVGLWSGDDFPEADAAGFFAGGVIGGDSVGLADNPHGGRLLFVDRPLNDAVHFMNLTRVVPVAGAHFSFDVGTGRNGVDGAADYDFFGLDADGHESFHIRIGTDADTQRLGYVAASDVIFDLPTAAGQDRVNDLASVGLPPFTAADDFATVSVHLRETGFTIDFANLNSSNRYTTSLLPYHGDASDLSRVGLYYRGSEGDSDAQSSLILDNLRVSVGELVADCNGDGVVDARDLQCVCGGGTIEGLLTELGLLQGDFDADGLVNFADFLVVSGNFNQAVESYSDGDLDCSGRVEFADFLVISENFGKSSSVLAAVPEPDTIAPFWLLLIVPAVCRRRKIG